MSSDLKTYIQMQEFVGGNSVVMTLEKAKQELEAMYINCEEGNEENCYTFQTIRMAEEAFKSLGEFEGF